MFAYQKPGSTLALKTDSVLMMSINLFYESRKFKTGGGSAIYAYENTSNTIKVVKGRLSLLGH